MLKRIFICVLMLAAICLSGCGSEKIVGSPDKAVLAFAEIAMTGASDNMSAAGFTADDQNEIRRNTAASFVESMASIAPLSDATAEQITNIYFDKLKGTLKFNAKLKKDDANRPIVELTATPIDQGETARKTAAKNDELIALIGMVGQLKADGATEDQLKENPDVQNLAVTALTKYVDNIHFKPEETFDVPCEKITGRDGNLHWAPADANEFVNFLTGKN